MRPAWLQRPHPAASPRSQRPHDAAAVVPAPSGGVARSWEAESRQQRLGDMWAAEARRQQLGELGRRRPRDSGSGAEPGGGGLATAALARRPAVCSPVGSCAEPGEGGEVRHWPPLPLEQEDKDGEGVDDRWALYYCS